MRPGSPAAGLSPRASWHSSAAEAERPPGPGAVAPGGASPPSTGTPRIQRRPGPAAPEAAMVDHGDQWLEEDRRFCHSRCGNLVERKRAQEGSQSTQIAVLRSPRGCFLPALRLPGAAVGSSRRSTGGAGVRSIRSNYCGPGRWSVRVRSSPSMTLPFRRGINHCDQRDAVSGIYKALSRRVRKAS